MEEGRSLGHVPSSPSLPNFGVKDCALPHAPSVIYYTATGPKQQDQVTANQLYPHPSLPLACNLVLVAITVFAQLLHDSKNPSLFIGCLQRRLPSR